MADRDGVIQDTLARWVEKGLVDASLADTLRREASEHEAEATKTIGQYVLATTGALVLVMAGGVFVDWAWPQLSVISQSAMLAIGGAVAIGVGSWLESTRRWRPAAYLMQTAGLCLLLGAVWHSERDWADQSAGGVLVGVLALATPVILAARSMRRSVVMPAIHMAMGLAFLTAFLDRATALSDDAIVWTLDVVLLGAILVLANMLRSDPEQERHPWLLNAFVLAMLAGFVLVGLTAVGPLSLTDNSVVPLDVWLGACVGLTLWGIHRAPAGLRKAWFERLLALEVLAWIPFGLITVEGPLDGGPALAVLLVGGAGVGAFLHGDRHGFGNVMMAAAACFIVPVWWWAVDAGGALGGVAALLFTAVVLFWASGRRR